MKLIIASLLVAIASIASAASSILLGSPHERTDNIEKGSIDGSDVTAAAMKKNRVRHLEGKASKSGLGLLAKSAKEGKTSKSTSTTMVTTTITTPVLQGKASKKSRSNKAGKSSANDSMSSKCICL